MIFNENDRTPQDLMPRSACEAAARQAEEEEARRVAQKQKAVTPAGKVTLVIVLTPFVRENDHQLLFCLKWEI